MKKKILIFHPDILKHERHSSYTATIYKYCEDLYEVKSLEWYITHFGNKKINCLYLNWYENTVGNKDSYLIQKIQYFIKYYILRISKIMKHRIVYVVHNKAPHNVSMDSKLYDSLYKPFMKKALTIADKIVLVSKSSLDYISNEYSLDREFLVKKTIYVPVGIYEQKDNAILNVRSRYNIDENELVYCYAGRMDTYKNIDLIIKAFMASEVKGKLLLVGPCNDTFYYEMKNLAGEDANIIIDNRNLTDEELTQIIATSNVMVLPYENTSMNSGTIVFSFSCATTVICTNIEMLQDYPNKLVYGYVHNSWQENVNALINEMNMVYQDYLADRLDSKGVILKEIVCEENNWNMVRKTLYDAIK